MIVQYSILNVHFQMLIHFNIQIMLNQQLCWLTLQYQRSQSTMKKKINISVAHLMNKNRSPLVQAQTDKQNIFSANMAQVFYCTQADLKKIRFEDIYKRAKQNSSPNSNQIIFDSKKNTPKQSHRDISNFEYLTKKSQKHQKSFSGISTPKSVIIQPKPKLSYNILQENSNQSSKTSHYFTPNSELNNIQKEPRSSSHKQTYIQLSSSNSKDKQKICHLQQQFQANMFDPPSPKLKPASRIPQEIIHQIHNVQHSQSVVQKWPHQCMFREIVKNKLDHSQHSHLHDHQCFLNQDEISTVMRLLGYQIENEWEQYFHDMLVQLEYDIYGGVPSVNLKQFLQIVDGYFCKQEQEQTGESARKLKKGKKIINNNLKLSATTQQKLQIYRYYNQLAKSKQNFGKNNSKTNNCKTNSNSKIMKFQDMLANKNLEIYNKTPNKVDEPYLQAEQWRTNSCDSQITELKNRLNKALEKVNQEKFKLYSDEKPNKLEETFDIEDGNSYQLGQRKPILSVDVNLGEGISEKIIVYEGQNAKEVSQRLAFKYAISEETRLKFQKMLEAHLNTMLWKIDEVSEELLTDRQ